jgi:hypothetical protein
MGWFADAELTVIQRAKACNQGITINRSATTERLDTSASGTDLLFVDNSVGKYNQSNQFVLWFRLNSLATIQTIYTSYDPTFYACWMQVNTDGTLMFYYQTGAGTGPTVVTITTGLTTGTLYQLAMLGGVVYLNNVAYYSIPGSHLNGSTMICIGARRASSTAANPATWSTANTYSYYASMTVFEFTSWQGNSVATSARRSVLYNAGNGLLLRRHILGRANSVRTNFLFDPLYLSGSSFANRLSSTTRVINLIQSGFLSLEFRTRVGTLVY